MTAIPQTTSQMIDLSNLSPENAMDKAIAHAVAEGASDLMLLAHEDYYALNIRQLGVIRPVSIVSRDLGKRLGQYIKAQAGMDVAEHRHPHDGRWIYDELVEEGAGRHAGTHGRSAYQLDPHDVWGRHGDSSAFTPNRPV